ncbi:MAG: primosomal protein N' [Candidatus Xiphinematobacter sp.]|nr:MAG: primosomal protein N' [Candidatus Xiphinematobacter sp.]
MPVVAKVVVGRSTGRALDYLVPRLLQIRVRAGTRVLVPLRTRVVQGIVIDISSSPGNESEKGLRAICEVSDAPSIQPVLISLAHWMAKYYCCSLGAALRCVLPSVLRKAQVRTLPRRGCYIFRSAREIDANERSLLEEKPPCQARLLLSLQHPERKLTLADAEKRVKRTSTLAHGTSTLAHGLERRGLVCIEKEQVYRHSQGKELCSQNRASELSAEQKTALREVAACIRDPEHSRPILLYGATGASKTEVYLGAIEETLRLGRTAMVLVPEISLTPQISEQLRSHFSSIQDQVIVLHSHLSRGIRVDAWRKIHSKQVRVVIGARSAVFSPINDLGLIIVDDEHEAAYKQEESPKYHARDIAVLRASQEKCAILLGSATPSLESFLNTRNGKYHLLRLGSHVDSCSLPVMRILDLRQLRRLGGRRQPILSEPLCSAIQERLNRREQTILFLNRRGFSTAMICTICGHVCQCPNCSLSMTYHHTGRLICHLCSHTVPSPSKCPSCRNSSIRHTGIGTQKIEEISRQLFPTARIVRVDADSMTRKNAYEEVLELFKLGQIDLLIGTQIIAKGLHFPNVTLVGIVNADFSLHITDFRAGERTFQLLTRIASSIRRGTIRGEVLIQTFTPFSPYIKFACQRNYEGFFEQEIRFRRYCGHPPFSHLILLTLRSSSREHADSLAKKVAHELAATLPPTVRIGEAVPAPLQRVKGKFRFHLAIRAKGISVVARALRITLDKLSIPSDVALSVDVDPHQLL